MQKLLEVFLYSPRCTRWRRISGILRPQPSLILHRLSETDFSWTFKYSPPYFLETISKSNSDIGILSTKKCIWSIFERLLLLHGNRRLPEWAAFFSLTHILKNSTKLFSYISYFEENTFACKVMFDHISSILVFSLQRPSKGFLLEVRGAFK